MSKGLRGMQVSGLPLNFDFDLCSMLVQERERSKGGGVNFVACID